MKNLVTAAFSKAPAMLLSSFDQHADWQRHQQQRSELATALTEANNDVARLQRARAQADHDVQEAQVLKFLGEEPPTAAPDAEARIVEVNAALATAQTRVAGITEALRRLDLRGEQLQNSIQSEMRAAIEAEARIVVKKFGQALKAASVLNDELARLQRYDFVTLPVNHWHELAGANDYSRLNQWLSAVQAVGWSA